MLAFTQVRHEPRGQEGGKLLGYDDPFMQCPPALIGAWVRQLHCVRAQRGGAQRGVRRMRLRHAALPPGAFRLRPRPHVALTPLLNLT